MRLRPSQPAYAPGAARRGRRVAFALLGAALLATAACDRSENQRAKADVVDATQTAGAGLNRAAAVTASATKDTVDDLTAGAKPAADKAARDTKHALDKMAVAAGRATKKAGDRLEHAGENTPDHEQ
ncbi:MAG: hypothetical protein ACYDD1_06220 [Caulobacteraceae bacterium]